MLLTATRTCRCSLTLLTAAGALLLGACSADAQNDSAAASVSIQALLQAPRTNWPTNGGSLLNQRYSPLDEINLETIDQVQAEWRTHLDSGLGPQHSGQGEPVVHEGVLYMITGENDVFALDVETGEILWKYDADIDPEKVLLCCGWVQRGIAVGEGKVFFGTLDARLMALDQETGNVIWDVQVEDPAAGYSITAAPRYYDGRVYTGLAGGEYQIRGSVQAFEADSGQPVWTFYTIPGPGEVGHDTWPQDNDAWLYGGAPVWQTPAVDPDLGMLYFSTGNPSPDQNGAIRPGDNLFTVSIVAIDIETGEYRWHFQQTRHDIWDYDSSSPVVLFDVMKDGEMRKGLSQISKSGYLFILDRITGEPLVGVDYVEVPQMPSQHTADTQPIPRGDKLIDHCISAPPEGWTLVNNGCTYTPFGEEPVLYKPLAGSNWMPTSYDPTTGYLYVCTNESIGGAAMEPFGEDELGEQTGNMIMGGTWTLPQGTPRISYQNAVDVRTNTLVWQFQSPAGCSSGSTVTAGDLLLIGRADGRLMAYNSADGMPVWEFQTDAGVMPSPVVFEHKGRQKIALFSAGTVFSSGPKGDSVWLLSLDGEMGPVAPDLSAVRGSPALNPAQVDLPESEPDLARGAAVYAEICAACHGQDGQGGHAEGGSIPRDIALENIYATAFSGGETMPAFGALYSEEDLLSVSVFIRETVLER